MKARNPCLLLVIASLSVLINHPGAVLAQSSFFTYNGRLNEGALPANGVYDLTFTLFAASNSVSSVAGPLTNSAVSVSNGLFVTTIDFGAAVFSGTDRWLEIAARSNVSGAFITLSPRQEITSVPYAIRAANATVFDGTVSDSQLSANVARLNANQTFTGMVIFNGPSNSYAGNFTGNGAGVTNLSAVSLAGAEFFAWPGKFVTASSPLVGGHPSSAIAVDINGDGKPDLICANGDSLVILTNKGSGSFAMSSSPLAGASPWSVSAADFNGDGKMDLVVANITSSGITVLTNNGTGGFAISSSTVVGNVPYCVVTADVNGDGKPDCITADSGTNTLTVLTNAGNGVMALAASLTVGSNPFSVAAADLSGSGKPDLISADWGNSTGSTLTVMTNNGNGGFAFAYTLSSPAPIAVTAGDLNGDGKMDVACVALYGNTIGVYTNNGSGRLVPASFFVTPAFPISITAADINSDGRVDLICAHYSNPTGGDTVSIFTNSSNGTFSLSGSLPVGNAPRSVVAADLNGDLKPDLITANDTDGTLTVLFNSPVLAGDGSGLTNVNAANISGTLADARLSGNVALRSGGNAFTGQQTMMSGNVGIGTTAPQTELQVAGGDGNQLRLHNTANSKYWNLYSESFNNSGYLVFVAGTPPNGYVYFDTAGVVHGASDEHLKKDILPLSSVLDRVLQLRPVSYQMRDAPADQPRILGLIAQEVEPLFPEVVGEHAGLKSLAYSELVPVTISAVQELNQKLSDELKRRDAVNAQLKQRLERLEALVSQKLNGDPK